MLQFLHMTYSPYMDLEQRIDDILDRGVLVEFLPSKEAFKARLLKTDQPMRIYIGADPTSTALHLSHAKNYMLLEELRTLGHKVYVLIGDFTARIGDPTDKSTARTQLTRDEVETNVRGWVEQIRPLMNFDDPVNPPELVYNNDWLGKLTMEDVVNLASNVTVQRMLERDMFQKRMSEEKPIFLHEFLYPLMQGYDSVALDVDAELCGTDQTFNALMGRKLQRVINNKEKFVIVVNLMANPITGELMSKSRGTGIFLNFTPFDIYGAIMSQPDEMTEVFLINNTRIPKDAIKEILAGNPRDAKMRAAWEVTRVIHGVDAANQAQDNFVRIVQNKEVGGDIPTVHVPAGTWSLMDMLTRCEPDMSKSELRRLLAGNAIKVDGDVVTDEHLACAIAPEGTVVKIGKKKWYRLIAE